MIRIERVFFVVFVKPQTNGVVNQSELTRGKASDLCDVGKNMQQLLRSAGKHATKSKLGITSVKRGINVTGAKRGKTCNQSQARENMQPMTGAECV